MFIVQWDVRNFKKYFARKLQFAVLNCRTNRKTKRKSTTTHHNHRRKHMTTYAKPSYTPPSSHVAAVLTHTPRGLSYARPVASILTAIGWPSTATYQRHFRRVAKHLRDNGTPIVGTRDGYFIAKNVSEFCVGLRNKLGNAAAALSEVERVLNRAYTYAK
jgi:hypothetical protein